MAYRSSTTPSKNNPSNRIKSVITGIKLDFIDIKQSGEVRKFAISGTSGAVFTLEVRDCHPSTGVCTYYNFKTNSFQSTKTGLNNIRLNGGFYNGSIKFPEVAAANKYDIFLFAESIYNTKHSEYNEVRFADGTIDINSCKGSNSNLVQKVIYQTLEVDITISGHSPNSTITNASNTSATITTSRNKSNAKIPFSLTWTSTALRTLKINRQPKAGDITSRVTRAVSLSPVDIPGETTTKSVKTGTIDVSGGLSGGTTTVTLDEVARTVAAIGDRMTGSTSLDAANVTVMTVSSGSDKTLTASVAPTIGDNETITFTSQSNHKWSLDNIHGLKPGMRVFASTGAQGNGFTKYATIKNYLTQITGFAGERGEYKIDDVSLGAIETNGVKPTFTRNSSTHVVTTTQEGDVIFSQQASIAFGLQNINIYGYGRSEINSLTGYDIEFSDLKVTLSEVSRTTTTAPSASATFDVTSAVGITENVSTVSGIGINPAVIAPTVTRIKNLASGTYTTGSTGYPAGELTLSAVQTLESGITLTFPGTGQVATISGNIKVNKVGNEDVTIYFDLEKFLTMNDAPAAV